MSMMKTKQEKYKNHIFSFNSSKQWKTIDKKN